MLDDTKKTLTTTGWSTWLKVASGAIVVWVAFSILNSIGGAFLAWQMSDVGFGSENAISQAWDEAIVQLISAFASVGTAAIITFREVVVDKIKAWWTKK